MDNTDSVFEDLDGFKRDVKKYHNFLLSQDIDVLTQSVSLEFLMAMFSFADIKGSTYYTKAICYYLKHKAKYGGAKVMERGD